MNKTKQNAALISIYSNSGLIISKFTVGIMSGSVSIISEAVHSFTDLLASFLAYFSIKVSSEPADKTHQYGHGKFEDLSGGLEGVLILIASAYIIYEAVEKIINKDFAHSNNYAGIAVMFISIIVNYFVSKYLFKIAEKTDSIALLADAQHLKADIATSAGVLLGLILIKITGIKYLDPIIAILIALMILKTGIELCKDSLKNLLDSSLPNRETDIIISTIKKYMSEHIIEFKNLKTRKAGPERLIEFTLIVPTDMSIKEGHDICDKIEKDLEETIRNLNITIHLEPCDTGCTKCTLYYKDSSIFCEKYKNK